MSEANQRGEPLPASWLAQVQSSAQGWHTVQLAALGFVGLCGVLKSTGAVSTPRAVQVLAAVLVILALICAVAAIFLTARIAWPLQARAASTPADDGIEAQRAARQLRTAIALTFVSVALMAAAATSAWWPARTTGSAGLVRVDTAAGTVCGALLGGSSGLLTLQLQGRGTDIPLGEVTALRPVSSCP